MPHALLVVLAYLYTVYTRSEENISIKHFAVLSYFKISFIITAHCTTLVVVLITKFRDGYEHSHVALCLPSCVYFL